MNLSALSQLIVWVNNIVYKDCKLGSAAIKAKFSTTFSAHEQWFDSCCWQGEEIFISFGHYLLFPFFDDIIIPLGHHLLSPILDEIINFHSFFLVIFLSLHIINLIFE